MTSKKHTGIPVGPAEQDYASNHPRRAMKETYEFGPNLRKSRTPGRTRSRAIDRSLRRGPNVHGSRKKNARKA